MQPAKKDGFFSPDDRVINATGKYDNEFGDDAFGDYYQDEWEIENDYEETETAHQDNHLLD